MIFVIGSFIEAGSSTGSSVSRGTPNPWRCHCSDPQNIDNINIEGWHLFRRAKAAELGISEREYSEYIQRTYPTAQLLNRYSGQIEDHPKWSEQSRDWQIHRIAWEETNPEDKDAAVEAGYSDPMTPARTLWLSMTQLDCYI